MDLHWLNLRADITDAELERELRKFTSYLASDVGGLVTITEASHSFRSDLESIKNLNDLRSQIDRTFYIILLPPNHPLGNINLESNRSAVWGASWLWWSFVYSPKDALIATLWHELFHLFNAHDCYDLPDEGPTCGLPNCIMQYAPTRADLSNPPFICEENAAKIRKRLMQ